MTPAGPLVAPGEGTVAIGDGAAGLFGSGPDGRLASALGPVLATGTTAVQVDAVLRGVAAAGPVEAFAVAVLEPDALRVFVAGAAIAVATDGSGGVTHHGADHRYAWTDLVLPRPAAVTLLLDAGADPAAATHPAPVGVVRASAVHLPLTSPEPAPSSPEPAPAPTPPTTTAEPGGSTYDFGHLLGDTRYGSVEDAAVRPGTDAGAPAPHAGSVPAPPHLAPVPPPAPPPPPVVAPVPAPPTVAGAPPRAEVGEPLSPHTQSFDTRTSLPDPPAPSGPPPRPAPERPTRLIDSVPGLPPVGPPPAAPAEPPGAGATPSPWDLAPGTVDAVDLDPPSDGVPHAYEEGSEVDDLPTLGLAQVRAARAAGGIPRPAVQAVHCPAGHPNPPYAEPCRSCGRTIDDRTVALVPRPVLGVLRSTSGDVVLDGPVLIGRKPPEGVVVDGEPARVVRVPDPDTVLSRTHVEIRLVDWQVQVVDRDSMNHTYVVLPGQGPVQLRPGEPYPIPIGTVVSLGDAAHFTYEVATGDGGR